MPRRLFAHPTAFVPVAMSLCALGVALGYAALYGTAPQPDEGTAAHAWQLLMVGQVPLMALFAIRWLPGQLRQALVVLVVQLSAAAAAVVPVWWFGW